MATTIDPREHGFKELLSRLRMDTTDLMRTEAELAKREVKEQLVFVQKRAAAAAVAGAVAHIGGLLVMLAICLLLGLVMPLWLATLLVGLAACAAAVLIALRQKQQLEEIDPAPKRAVQRLQADYHAVKEAHP